MAEPVPDWLADIPARFHDPLRRTADGLPPNVGLMLLLMESAEPGEAERVLRHAAETLRRPGPAEGAQRLAGCLALLRDNPDAERVVRAVLAGLDHRREAAGAGDALAYWAAAFDRAAERDPEVSVALYSLGNPDLLEAATQEIVDKLADWGLLGPEVACLDIGCGIGRFERALAPRLERITGIDISERMVAAARDRCAGLANVELRTTTGRDLSDFADRSFDLVLAADSFPYLVQSGRDLTDALLDECARVLRPAGWLAILNYSYRGDLEQDRADLTASAERAGFRIIRDGTRDLSLWDGAAFLLRKSAPDQGSR